MKGNQQLIFFLGPGVFFDVGVKMVVPSLTALLSNTPIEVRSDERPLLGTVFVDELNDLFILFLGPGSFLEVGIEDFLPAVKALNICFLSFERSLCNLLPVLAIVLLHSLPQRFVFIGRPLDS